jgi:uncharacterized cupin superfamily protein
MTPSVEKLTPEQIEQKGIHEWPVWTKEISTFPYHYGQQEQCLILEGEIIITSDNQTTSIHSGDFVTFPAGLDCTWTIITPVKKHYQFG